MIKRNSIMAALIATFILFTNSTVAETPNWVEVGKDSQHRLTYFVDTNNVKKYAKSAEVWIKVMRADGHNVRLHRFDCGDMTTKTLIIHEYDVSGAFMRTYKSTAGDGHPAPGSLLNEILSKICV